jgi:threonine dehydratase
MTHLLPSLADIEAAATVVYRDFPPTPQYRWGLLSERLGTECWLKHENHTPVGAFKIRGGLTYFDQLARRGPLPREVISATRGNHGQSMGWAARRHGVACTIVVPRGNSLEKNAAMRALGVTLVEHGDDFQEAREHALHLAQERGAHMVPSFHPDLLRGVATYWWEFLRAVPQLDVVYVPIGQGSGACSAIAAKRALGHGVRIVGVVSTPRHHLRRLHRRRPGGRSTGHHATGRWHGLPRGRPGGAGHPDPAPGPCGAGQRRRSGRRHARPVHRHAQRRRRRRRRRPGRRAAGARSLRGQCVGLALTGGNVDAPVFSEVLSQ